MGAICVMHTMLNIDDLPEYHENLLFVRERPAPGRWGGGAPRASAAAPIRSASNCLRRLAELGVVQQVVALSEAHEPAFAYGMEAGAVSLLPEAPEALDGLSLLKLEAGADIPALRMLMAQDDTIASVDRVPMRYLMVPARRGAARGPRVAAATPPAAPEMWNMRRIQWQQAVDSGLGLAEDVHVAVLDSGIDLGHPDLPGGDITYVHEYRSGVAASREDIHGHGSHVAGTIRAVINNDVGINGICACALSAYKIFGDTPVYIARGDYFAYVVEPAMYLAALARCIRDDVDVINLSIGGYAPPDPVESELYKALNEKGVIIVAAMGNDDTSRPSYPAAIPGVIAVGATNIDDSRAWFSNTGSHIAMCAPGVGIWSTLPTYPGQTQFEGARDRGGRPVPGRPVKRETNYAPWDGTSMASPHVAAAAAMALSKHGRMSRMDMLKLLTAAVDKVPGMNGHDFTEAYGYGRLNLAKV